jgi:hypothetical protein
MLTQTPCREPLLWCLVYYPFRRYPISPSSLCATCKAFLERTREERL